MPNTNTDIERVHDDAPLLTRIERSALLSPDQKERAKAFAATAPDGKKQGLAALLETEPAVLQTMVQRTVEDAAAEGKGADVTGQLDGFFKQAGKYLRQSGEYAERSTETADAESLLDAA